MLRTITHRTQGTTHGPITRLIDPSDLGEQLKPFVFLDHFNAEVPAGFGFGWHPHSGIATLTWQPDLGVQYEDTTGHSGVLPAGGLEWMNAGGGAWHRGSFAGPGHAQGFQLWVAMSPEVENAPAMGQYVAPEEVPRLSWDGGELLVLLGELALNEVRHPKDEWNSGKSPIQSHQDMVYAVLKLAPGARWRHTPPSSHTVAWVFPFDGAATVQGEEAEHALHVLGPEGDLLLGNPSATKPARILIGTARPHHHPLVLGRYSIHTSREALRHGEAGIRAIRQRVPSAA